MIDKAKIVKYYHDYIDEEGVFVKTLDLLDQVDRYFEYHMSDFLSPALVYAFEKILQGFPDIQYEFIGGVSSAERMRLQMFPSFLEAKPESEGLKGLQIKYQSKFNTLDHRDALGALMGLGIQRFKVGDIIVKEDVIHVIVVPEIAEYIKQSLSQVGKAGVKVSSIALSEIHPVDIKTVEVTDTVKSLRLDSIIASAYKCARSEAKQAIEKEYVKLNYCICQQPSTPVEQGAVISYRGKGRAILQSIEGTTKKDRIRIVIAKLI